MRLTVRYPIFDVMVNQMRIILLTMISFGTMVSQAQDTPSMQLFNLNDYEAPASDQVYWKEIYNGETIRAGYYHLKAGAKDDQNPHDFDEVYWIKKGKAKIRIGSNDFDIAAGDAVFVQAKQTHYFHQITETLDILVLFSKAAFDSHEKIDQINALTDLTKSRDANKNVWNDFLKRKSMTFGLYMLPAATGGDKALTHHFDEINFVVEGSAKFIAGEQEVEVGPGSLFFVPKNTPHYFETTNGIDVFILFENKSTQ